MHYSFTVEEVRQFCRLVYIMFRIMIDGLLDPCAHGQARQYPEHVRYCSWYAQIMSPKIELTK